MNPSQSNKMLHNKLLKQPYVLPTKEYNSYPKNKFLHLIIHIYTYTCMPVCMHTEMHSYINQLHTHVSYTIHEITFKGETVMENNVWYHMTSLDRISELVLGN